MGSSNDHNLISIILSVSLLVLGFLGYMGRGWVIYVNASIEKIWTEFKTSNDKREDRWKDLEKRCEDHLERIVRTEVKVKNTESGY
jgi:hypothetical protein